jgi:hypothetical protein
VGYLSIPDDPEARFAIYVQEQGQLKDIFHEDISSLEQFADRNVQRLQNSNFGNRLIPRGVNSTTLGDYNALRTESISEGFLGDKTLHIWSLVGGNAYSFIFSAKPAVYKQNLPTIEKMVELGELLISK